MRGWTTTTTWSSGRRTRSRPPIDASWFLLAAWYNTAVKRALEGQAKLKYFEHAGCLLTADGSDDDLVKFEGTPPGYKLTVPNEYLYINLFSLIVRIN